MLTEEQVIEGLHCPLLEYCGAVLTTRVFMQPNRYVNRATSLGNSHMAIGSGSGSTSVRQLSVATRVFPFACRREVTNTVAGRDL